MSNQIHIISKWFKRFYLFCFLSLSMGIPLIFSSATRSVFEVNKLLFLRLIILILCGAWLFKSCLLKDNGIEHSNEESYSIFGFKWRRIGLETPILCWIITNLISIIISQNIFISLVGAYDRWEGLATILNYIILFYMTAKLIDSTKYRIIIFCICLFSTSISSFYGVIQSLGIDFMNWSTSPTSRVFACINNPVHFCAYVAMTVSIGLSLSHYFLHKLNSIKSFIRVSYMSFLYGSVVIGYSIVSLFILSLLNLTISSVSHIQFLSIFAITAAIFYFYDNLLPNKKMIRYLILWGITLLLLASFDFFLISVYQLTLLLLGLGICYCLRAWGNLTFFLFRLCNATTFLVFYSMLLSFSRATIIGYVVCIAFFYQLIFQNSKSPMTLLRWIFLFFGSALTQIFLIFKVYLFGTAPLFLALFIWFISFLLIYYASSNTFPNAFLSFKKLFFSFLLFSSLILPYLAISFITIYFFPIICLIMLSFHWLKRHVDLCFIKNCLCLFILLNLLFYFSNAGHIIFFFVLLSLLYCYVVKPQFSVSEQFHIMCMFIGKSVLVIIPLTQLIYTSFIDLFLDFTNLSHIINYSLLFILFFIGYYMLGRSLSRSFFIGMLTSFIFGIVFIYIFPFQSHQNSINQIQSDRLAVARTIEGRMTNLSNNKARLYMWLSVPAWVLDHPLFGSGPDTIRHLYPVYRHPKYGIHEGGHNFTPDRLHNEYLNTLSTKGIIGFIIKYIFVFGAWYLIMLRLFIKYSQSRKHYILAGIIVAPSIYLVQVLFNFGVVATLFLFYFLLGIGLSFINDEYEDYETA